MEDYIQFSAKTKSEAITKACIELGVSSDLINSDCCLHYTSSISLRTVGCCDESEKDCFPVRQFILLYFLHDKFTDLISPQSCLVHIY